VSRIKSELRLLQLKNVEKFQELGYDVEGVIENWTVNRNRELPRRKSRYYEVGSATALTHLSEDGRATRLKPDLAKTFISMGKLCYNRGIGYSLYRHI